MSDVKRYKLWEVKVQKDRPPYSFEKVRLVKELSQIEANKVWETSIKHPRISDAVIWLSFKLEKKYGVGEMVYCYLEDFKWTNE